MSGCKKKKYIANTISRVPRELSDQEKISWLFVLIHIKAVQLRTILPLSFWIYTGQDKTLIRNSAG